LAELRKRGEGVSVPGQITVTNELGDVAAKHALPENRHATFQVASQFNCLEFIGPSVKPEDGITRYVMDKTQGPACSIACGPATAYRNYFAIVPGAAKGQRGQTSERQIDNLADVSKFLGNVPNGKLYDVRGGYTLAEDRRLVLLSQELKRLEEEGRLDEVREKLRVGVHDDVQVTSTDWGRRRVDDPEQTVTQVFGSACSVAYSRGSSEGWKAFASVVLEASYEATLWAALLAAQRHRGEGGSRKVFLTCLGGGAFGNPLDWIMRAMRRALDRFEGSGLDVRIVTYAGRVDPQLLALARAFAPGRPCRLPAAPPKAPLPAAVAAPAAAVEPPRAVAVEEAAASEPVAPTVKPAAKPPTPAAAKPEGESREATAPVPTAPAPQPPAASSSSSASAASAGEGAKSVEGEPRKTTARRRKRGEEQAEVVETPEKEHVEVETPEKGPAAVGKHRGRAKAKAKVAKLGEVPLDEEVLSEAQKLGLERVLRTLAARADVAASGASGQKVLDALQASGGLLHPAKRALLGAAA